MSKTQANRTNTNRPTHPPDRTTSRAALEAARTPAILSDAARLAHLREPPTFSSAMADRARAVLPPRDLSALRALERIAAARAKGDVSELRRIAKRAEEDIMRTGSSRAVCLLDAANDAISDFCKAGAFTFAVGPL